MAGNLRVTGLEVTGSADISSNLRVTGSAEISTNLDVIGNTTVAGDISLLQGSRLRFNNPGQNDIFLYASTDNRLIIDGDDTTTIIADNGITFSAGVSAFFEIGNNFYSHEDARYIFNTEDSPVDFLIKGSNSGVLFVDGGDNTIILGGPNYDSSPQASEVSGYGNDVKIMLSGTVGSKDTSTRGVVLMTGDAVISGSLEIEGGLSGSLTQLIDGTSYLIAGANTTITSGSNGSITIASTGGAANAFSTFAIAGQSNVVADSETDTLTFVGAGGMTITTDAASDTITFTSSDTDTNTQNTLDQAYDEGGSGAGRSITVDSGPVALKESSIGTGDTVLAVTGSAIFGNATSDALYPSMPGPDTNFFVSGSIGSAGSNNKGTSAFGGDVSISGSLSVNTVTVTTDGKIGIGTTSPSHKLEVGGNASFGEYLYHRGDTDTFIQFADDSIGITAGNEQLITISQVDAGQDIVKIGDGGDVDFQVRTDNDDNTLYVRGDTDRVGIGTNAPVSVLHIKESAPTLSMQRENNSNDSTIAFLGASGFTGAIMHLSSSNDLVFKTHDGSSPHEILRLGGHYSDDVRQIIMLSGSDMHAGAMQPKEATDINFFVSGSMMTRETATRGTAVFGGDLVVSGGIYSGRLTSLEDPESFIDLSENVVQIGANHTVLINSQQSPGDDVGFFVSGSIDEAGDPTDRGISVFGGDLVVSGTIFNGNGAPVGGKKERHIKYNNFSLNHNSLELFWPGSDGESANTTIPFNQQRGFLAPYSGSISKIQIRGQSSNTSNVYRFYTSPGSIDNPPNPVGHFSGSGETGHQATEYDIIAGKKRFKGGATTSQTYVGNFNFDPGDLITISYQVITGVAPGNVNVAIHLDYDTTSIIE